MFAMTHWLDRLGAEEPVWTPITEVIFKETK